MTGLLRRVCVGLAAVVVLSLSLGISQSVAQTASSPASPAGASEPSAQSTVVARNVPAAAATPGLAGRAVDKVKAWAADANEIFRRVPCASSKKTRIEVSLPRVARRIASDEPVTIVAFGSSSTQGYGASSTAFSYPNRLANQLRRAFPKADIKVINQGVGGEDAQQMLARLQNSVLNMHPDLVIWQLGTNALIRGEDIEKTEYLVDDGIKRIRAAGADIVLVDPQYAPAVLARKDEAGKMVAMIRKVAHVAKVGLFPRFQVMQSWHDDQALPIDTFVYNDGLHMNDWGYACFAQLLGDTIIKSVKEAQAGVEVPSNILTYRPM